MKNELSNEIKTTSTMSTTKIKIPAGKLRIDGATYQHRAVLCANGWKREVGRGSSWYKTTTTATNVPVRKGCRLVAGSVLVYDVGGITMTAEQIHAI